MEILSAGRLRLRSDLERLHELAILQGDMLGTKCSLRGFAEKWQKINPVFVRFAVGRVWMRRLDPAIGSWENG
jgi:hypothetical protein